MKKLSVLLFGLLLAIGAHAGEEGVGDKIERGVTRGGKAAAGGIEKGAEATGRGLNKAVGATGRGLKKAGDWLDGKSSGKSGDKK